MKRIASVFGLLFALQLPGAAQSIQELARSVRVSGLDPTECYRVRDLRLTRDDLRFFFDDGYLIFGKAVNGARLSAVFTADVEAGDAELLVIPPHRSERSSLAFYTHSPNLEQHFDTAAFIFTDKTYAELMQAIAKNGPPENAPERGAELAQKWALPVQDLLAASSVHILSDLLSGNDAISPAAPAGVAALAQPATTLPNARVSNGFFYAALYERTLGNFTAIYDPRAREQITLGQVVTRGQQAYFDVWTRFQGRAFRAGRRTTPPPDIVVNRYHIDATLDASLRMHVIVEATFIPGAENERALVFDLSPRLHLTEVRVDGAPAEFLQPGGGFLQDVESDISAQFLVVAPRPLAAGKEHNVEFHYDGGVISDHGDAGYFVAARSSWYPQAGPQFARYDLTFHYPPDIDFVATGTRIEEHTEGGIRTAHYRMDEPVRMAGFNLGHYRSERVARGNFTVDVYANRRSESLVSNAPQLPPTGFALHSLAGQGGIPAGRVDAHPVETEVRPSARLPIIAADVAGSLEFLSTYFGPPALKSLSVAPIPGDFGQGFPGLIYLATLAYRDPKQVAGDRHLTEAQIYASEVMCAHETAHQWWGNIVATDGDADHWLMEALANYSALLYLEKQHGTQALDAILNQYKLDLLQEDKDGRSTDSTGPISWGPRLINSQSPDAYRAIIYEKGSWIMHMLRERMGDERFLAMLGGLLKRYSYSTLDTEDFRKFAAGFLPPKSADPKLENFFEQWVYSTGIPIFKLEYKTRVVAGGVEVIGAVTQTEADPDFTAYVPVVIETGKGKAVIKLVRTSSEPVPFTIVVPQTPARVLLDPANTVLHQ